MYQHQETNISSFFITGINYKKTDAGIRGQFAVNNDQYEKVISLASSAGVKELFILSTCNRTEIYGFAENALQLASLLCSQTEASLEEFQKRAYTKCGKDAIEHLFNVAAGLDSQILGDYEIIGQIKQSAKFSKSHGFVGAYLERMINGVLQASKKIRTNTALSGGTVSVSFAAVQYIKARFETCVNKKILLLGTGKIGSNTCKNLADYLPGNHVTLMNRTLEKAQDLASTFGFGWNSIDNIRVALNEADIILVATNADEPIVLSDHFQCEGQKLIIDLSVPCNVAVDVKCLDTITLINVDELSKIKDETLQKRAAEVPKVKLIIAEHVSEFLAWHDMRRHVPVLKDVKNKLLTIQFNNIENVFTEVNYRASDSSNKAAEDKIQRVINGMAVKLRTHNQPGCHYIQAINDFISPASTS